MNDVGGCEVRGMTHSQFSMSWNSSSSSWLGLSDPLQVQTLDAIEYIWVSFHMGITQCNSIEFTEKSPGAAAIVIQDLYTNQMLLPLSHRPHCRGAACN